MRWACLCARSQWIWFADADADVDQAAVARYRESGIVVAEWDSAQPAATSCPTSRPPPAGDHQPFQRSASSRPALPDQLISGYACQMIAHCPYLAPSLPRGLTTGTVYRADGYGEAVQVELFHAGVQAAEWLRPLLHQPMACCGARTSPCWARYPAWGIAICRHGGTGC
ncbi:hypothetical protein ACFUJY_22140 [Streptomyces sp. NPDC057249]|uniref:hypothetical protein n=1 Tax=Streptomyces sp. NPDC057249 TaxID=3346067 RepID=UPI00364111DE